MSEEEVRAEVEAVEAVYGDDCHVIEAYPPHLHVHLKPRTADVTSQQFVEATIEMRAGPQYPEEPPQISVIDSKGLDEQRQNHLLASVSTKALELASCLVLVALCEEAVERLSSMNHPDGNCPLCLHPLRDEDFGSNSPFMKLMSCFHCFHCDCIIRWWSWTQDQSEKEIKSSSSSSSSRITRYRQGMSKQSEEDTAKCPVCRKVFLAKDIEHVLDLVGIGGRLDSDGIERDEDVLHSDSEKTRREKFEAILKLQQENNGLIELKKTEVLLPGVFLPPPVVLPSTESNSVSSESRGKDSEAKSDMNPGSSFNSPGPRRKESEAKSDMNPGSSFNRPGPRKHSNMRKHRIHAQDSGKQDRIWIKKDNVSKN